MELISTVHCPEMKGRNMLLTSVCYISKANIVIMGTDLGKIYFYDIMKSTFLKIEGKVKHSLEVTSIVNYEVSKNLEFVFITSLDGLVSIWELDRQELKIKIGNNNDNDINKLSNFNALTKKDIEKLSAKELLKLREFYTMHSKEKLVDRYKAKSEEEKENDDKFDKLKNALFRYTPNLRHVLNSEFALKEAGVKVKDYEIYCCQYSKWSDLLYTGGAKGQLYAWSYLNGLYKNSFKAHEFKITCMTFDRHLLISGDAIGKICIWSTELNSLLFILENKENTNGTIVGLEMLSNFGVLISINSYKQIEFWKYESKSLIKTLPINKEITCMTFVDYYGKLLCGTVDSIVTEKDLGEIFNTVGINHNFSKFPFLNQVASNNKRNDYEPEYKVDNYKIMKTINRDFIN
jgi:WD40 repeat protein